MHLTAEKNAKLFYQNYFNNNVGGKNIIDFGSLDINGCLKPIFKDAMISLLNNKSKEL